MYLQGKKEKKHPRTSITSRSILRLIWYSLSLIRINLFIYKSILLLSPSFFLSACWIFSNAFQRTNYITYVRCRNRQRLQKSQCFNEESLTRLWRWYSAKGKFYYGTTLSSKLFGKSIDKRKRIDKKIQLLSKACVSSFFPTYLSFLFLHKSNRNELRINQTGTI